jgi:hypothetical protein
MDSDKILKSLDRIESDIVELKITSAKQEENLKEHIRRTEIAEENITLIREEIRPLKDHVIVVNGVLKVLGVVSIIITSVAGFLGIFDKIINYLK